MTDVLSVIIVFVYVHGIYDSVSFMSAMDIANNAKAMSPKSVDEFGLPKPCPWHCHELLWQEFSPDDASFASAVRYLNTRMFLKRDLEPIQDMQEFNQLAHTLTKYRNQFCGVEAEDMRYYHEMTRETGSKSALGQAKSQLVFETNMKDGTWETDLEDLKKGSEALRRAKSFEEEFRQQRREYDEMKQGLANHKEVLQMLRQKFFEGNGPTKQGLCGSHLNGYIA